MLLTIIFSARSKAFWKRSVEVIAPAHMIMIELVTI
jgi:hypothetical protein